MSLAQKEEEDPSPIYTHLLAPNVSTEFHEILECIWANIQEKDHYLNFFQDEE